MQQHEDVPVGIPSCIALHPHCAGTIPPSALSHHNQKPIQFQQTMYRDTPAPFSCLYCGNSGLTIVRSKPSLASLVGCMMPMMLGFCFLCPSMDCLWHKRHYCPTCNEKIAEFKKTDPCAVMDPPQWIQESFALPAY